MKITIELQHTFWPGDPRPTSEEAIAELVRELPLALAKSEALNVFMVSAIKVDKE